MDPIADFLVQPISGSTEHHLAYAYRWHGRLMVLSWGIMIPLGIIVARYFKITRHQNWPVQLDNRLWWRAHLALQIGGVALSLLALGFALVGPVTGGSLSVELHVLLGWAIVLLGLTQVLGGALRGTRGYPVVALDAELASRAGVGDHFDMTLRRCVFEYAHKLCGYAAIVLAGLNIALGLALTDAPRWMWLVIGLFWISLGVLALLLQRQGRCVDTYQAIYGPEATLPGNRREPIGWGVRRYRPGEWPPRPLSRRA